MTQLTRTGVLFAKNFLRTLVMVSFTYCFLAPKPLLEK